MEKETKRSLLLITFGVVLFALLMHFPTVIKTIQRGIALILPIIIGLILAFVLNVPMKMFEQLFTKIKKEISEVRKNAGNRSKLICDNGLHRSFDWNCIHDVCTRTCNFRKKYLYCFYGKYTKMAVMASE